MTYCCAPHCNNRSENGWRVFRFPTSSNRKAIWVQNIKRGDNWTPSASSRLCEAHFELSQFERQRVDGWKKLKPNAIPTLFEVPNSQPMIDQAPKKSIYKSRIKGAARVQNTEDNHSAQAADFESEFILISSSSESKVTDEFTQLKCHIDELRTKLQEQEKVSKLSHDKSQLVRQIEKMDTTMRTFLEDSQIKKLQGRLSHWSNESIVKGLRFKFALSYRGYKYLRETGYPLPSYSTVMRRIQEIKVDFGIFKDIIELLTIKVQTMDPSDRFCVLSYEEIIISPKLDHNKTLEKSIGHVTLGNNIKDLGENIFIVIVRGIKSEWKQVIACHVMPKESIDEALLEFMLECIAAAEACGLHVLALSSNLDDRDKSIWASLGICVTKSGIRRNSTILNDHEIFAMPNPCHLLINAKAAMLRHMIHLPKAYVELESLPTDVVNGAYVKQLYDETSRGLKHRFLHHLQEEDIEPEDFKEMNVNASIRFFSPSTASGLKSAVEQGILPDEALTTAHFILIIHDWFSLLSSKDKKTSITARNCHIKFIFLHSAIDLFQNTVFGEEWKPLNSELVMVTLTFCDVAEFLFHNGFEFVSGHFFTQDPTENISSQVRSKAGTLPSALEALTCIRLISISQFASEVKNSSCVPISE